METKTYDTSRLEQAHQILSAIAERRVQKPANPWDGIYYELMSRYFENILKAGERGQKVVTTSDVVPSEILYAMDMVPYHISMVSCAAAVLLGEQETCLSAAKSFGLAPEVCSVHRIAAAFFVKGWAPTIDAVVSNNESCDNNAKSSELIAEAYKVPGFYFDCPFYFGERAFHFLTGEMEDLFKFLGEVKGQPLDQEKLVEVLKSSRQVVELSEEINRLRQAVPYPANSRLGLQSHLVRWYFQGRPEAVEFLELVRDELRRRVDAGQGPPDQRFRFISLFLTPNHQLKLLDWMEREHGAYIIQDPDRHHWGPIDWDFSRPMYTLANRLLAEPVAYLTYSPIQKWVDAIVEDTRDSKADGVIFWAHTACRQACATIRVVKDALTERDIPSLVLDVDTNDPSFVSEDELKDRLEGFMERIEENR